MFGGRGGDGARRVLPRSPTHGACLGASALVTVLSQGRLCPSPWWSQSRGCEWRWEMGILGRPAAHGHLLLNTRPTTAELLWGLDPAGGTRAPRGRAGIPWQQCWGAKVSSRERSALQSTSSSPSGFCFPASVSHIYDGSCKVLIGNNLPLVYVFLRYGLGGRA